MTPRQRILATLHGEHADSLPFFHLWRHSQVGWAERECRNRGMGMCWARPPYVKRMHGVDVTVIRDASAGIVTQRHIYHTPVGSIYLDEKRERGVGEWHGQRSWRDVSPWQVSRLIKGPDDYEVLKYVVDHTDRSTA